MLKRQRFLLGVVDFLQNHNRCTKLDIIKVMFIIAKEKPPSFSMYGFFPYKWGPFSFQIYSDFSFMMSRGLVNETEKECYVTSKGITEELLSVDYKIFLEQILERYPTMESIIDYVYSTYPSYTIRSQRKNVPKKVHYDQSPGFFLIGYEARTIDAFINELIQNNIHILIDVRNNPRSMNYEFNKGRLSKTLSRVEIEYENIPELGIEGNKRKHLETQEDYERLFEVYASELTAKTKWIDHLFKLAENKRAAIMCFERDFRSCHRREIGKYLIERNYPVTIIS